MFKNIFTKLCNEKGIAPTTVCQHIGLSNAAYSCWDENTVPRKTTLLKLADYFGVTTDYLLGKTDIKEKPGTDVTPTELSEDIKKLNEILKTLPPEKVKEIENYALFVSKQQNQ